MDILFFCPIWGMAQEPLGEALQKIKQAGYDGIEFGFPENDPEREVFLRLTREMGLLTIGQQCFAGGEDFKAYRESYRSQLEWLLTFEPLLINSHTGKDHYSPGQNEELIGIAQDMRASIVHETHRGRFAFCPSACRHYMDRFPGLRFTADFSHFCTVSESFLEDQEDTLKKIRRCCDHIHARVGHPQGPQVTDPRLPEFAFALDKHLAWWDDIVAIHRAKGSPRLTITPEFGPPPYMPLAPATLAPLASQWDINLYMMRLLQLRYG